MGVDIRSQPNFPFEFHRQDALRVLAGDHDWPSGGALVDPDVYAAWAAEWQELDLGRFDAIHASPPCQASSALKSLWPDREHPELIPATRELLEATGLPYVIENVVGAALSEPVMLCGSMFGLRANGRQLRRHRLFECSFPTMRPPCQHRGQPVGVYGHGGGGDMTRGYKGTAAEYREAMGIDWATKAEIAQAIPPAMTEFIGGFLRAEVRRRSEVAA
ncbi:MAG TPA: hypothetical protein VGN13_12555 [Solirubrobacteraceae bacterium]